MQIAYLGEDAFAKKRRTSESSENGLGWHVMDSPYTSTLLSVAVFTGIGIWNLILPLVAYLQCERFQNSLWPS
jgi:hypothetical protein